MRIEQRRYGRGEEVLAIPDLTELQIKSYEDFLQADVPGTERADSGLEAIIREVFPIESYDKRCRWSTSATTSASRATRRTSAAQLRLTYGMPFQVRVRLEQGRSAVEEDVYLGEIPIMIGGGEFIINGAERVIVIQLHRSPGVDFLVEVQQGDRQLHSLPDHPRARQLDRDQRHQEGRARRPHRPVRQVPGDDVPARDGREVRDRRGDHPRVLPDREGQDVAKSRSRSIKGMHVVGDIVDPRHGEVLVTARRADRRRASIKIIAQSDLKSVEVIDGRRRTR